MKNHKTIFSKLKLLVIIVLCPFLLIGQIKEKSEKTPTFQQGKKKKSNPFPLNFNKKGVVEYPSSHPIKDKSKTQLYDSALLWFKDTFLNYTKGEILLTDKEAGVILGRGYMVESHKEDGGLWLLWVDIKIKVKDDFFKYTISNFQIQTLDSQEGMVVPHKTPVREPVEITGLPPLKLQEKSKWMVFKHVKYFSETIKAALKKEA